MTAALKNISKDTLLRMLSGLWPKSHGARSWRKVREEHQRKINRVCGCLGIKPLECPTCGTILRNTDREMLREDGKTLPFDADTPQLERYTRPDGTGLRCAVCDREILGEKLHHYRTNAFGDTIPFCSEVCYWEDNKG